jgi:uncharacterized protein
MIDPAATVRRHGSDRQCASCTTDRRQRCSLHHVVRLAWLYGVPQMELGAAEIGLLALGARLLGSGGGGDPFFASVLALQAVERCGPVRLLSADGLPTDASVVAVGMIGAPAVIIEKPPNGRELTDVVRGVERHAGVETAAVMPYIVGGVNTLLPIAVAAELGLPLLDADWTRRTFARLEQSVLTLVGISCSPVALADEKGNVVMVESSDNHAAERLARAVTMAMGGSAAIALPPLSAFDVSAHAIQGSVSYCLEVGRRIQAVQGGASGALRELLAYTGGELLFAGKVIDVDRRTTAAFAVGTVVIEHLRDRSRTLRLEVQNENLLAFEDGRAVAMVPDLICVVDSETGTPITTEELSYGQRVNVLALPSAPAWRTDAGVALVGPRAFNYQLDYRPFATAATA